MTTAILDTNVIVRALISRPHTSAARTIDACHDHRYRLAYSADVLDEWIETLLVPHIQSRHGLSDDEVLEFLASLVMNATRYSGKATIPLGLVRDVTDRKFLCLAHESNADFLVTKDRRHLLHLRKYRNTEIVTPARFLRKLI